MASYNYYNPWASNGFPQQSNAVAGQYYQQAPQPVVMPQVMPQQTQSDGITWVQGEVGARAYPVSPGKMAVLMDSEDSVFYIKAVDNYGMPQPLRKFRFTEETADQKNLPQASQADMSNYITRDELEKRLDELTK